MPAGRWIDDDELRLVMMLGLRKTHERRRRFRPTTNENM
jgi:hypothetical protein